jgi:glycosyltransferase involved in cell wall biosynthesis
VQQSPRFWVRNETATPDLTIYIPTAKRPELANLLASLAPQLTERVEVIVSDNDPTGSAFGAVKQHLGESVSRVEYSRRRIDIGGDANILRGIEAGRGAWLWIIGDDDTVLPGALDNILAAIDEATAQRLILLSPEAPRAAAGVTGPASTIAKADPSLLIAATLISANVMHRDYLNPSAALAKIDTKFGQAWAVASIPTITVLDQPCITVGKNHAGENITPNFGAQLRDIWAELLTDGYGLDVDIDNATRWNYITAQA